MPFINENEYKIFSWSKIYKINSDECKNKLIKLEQFREFIWSSRPHIWLPLIILSSILAGILSYLLYHNMEHIKEITVWLTMIIYVVISIGYYVKIKKAIYCDNN